MFAKYLLSVGDWTLKVWNEELKTPIIGSKYHDSYLTSARWSPTRPGVFYSARADGYLDVWDYYEKQHEPVLSQQMGDQALETVRVRGSGVELAVGGRDGSVAIVRPSASLTEPQPNERATVQAMFERETNRVKAADKAIKENKIKARRAEAEAAKLAQQQAEELSQEEMLKKVEEDFEADLALIGDDPFKPIDLSALKAKPKTDVPPSQPSEAGGADAIAAQPAAEQSPGPS
jgi:dynein intermediate chain 2